MVSVGSLVVCLALSQISSPDIGYHLSYGRHFLDTGEIVSRDPFIYAVDDHDFVNANWGAQVVMALVERAAGPRGLTMLAMALIATTFAGITVAARCGGVNWIWIGPLWLAAALGAYERFGLRPELFSLAALAWAVAILLRRGGAVVLVLLAVVQVCWTNSHSYFVVGPIVCAAMLAGAAMRSLRRRPRGDERPAIRWLGAALLIQSAACLANPRGIAGALFPLQTLEMLQQAHIGALGEAQQGGGAWSAISEFQAPLRYVGYSICHWTIDAYVALLSLAAAATIAALVRGRVEAALAIVVLAAMSLTMRRNIAPFSVAAMPLAFAAFARLSRRADEGARAPGSTSASLRWFSGAGSLAATVTALWLIPSVVSGGFYAGEKRINRSFGWGYSDRFVPTAACDWLMKQPKLRPRLFADFSSASNVLPFASSRFDVFIDTNTFAYPPAALATMWDVCQGRRPHQPFFDEQGINIVLLRADDSTRPLVAAMVADPAWALVWFDRAGVIFIRRIPEHVPVIAAHRVTAADLDTADWISATHGRPRAAALELTLSAGVPLLLGWFEQSVTLLREATRLDPGLVEAWFNAGVSHAELAKRGIEDEAETERVLADMRSAATCFERVLTLQPGHEMAKLYLMRVRQALGDGDR